MWILVPQPGLEPKAPAMEVWSLNHQPPGKSPADVLCHHLTTSLLLQMDYLPFFSRNNVMSQMFSFAEKLYAARLKDKTGNIN